MSIKNRKFTDSTLFLLPIFGLEKREYDRCGFINAFCQDDSKIFADPCCLLLFRSTEENGELQSDLITLFDELVIDHYCHPGDLTVIALRIPDEFRDDYLLITEGDYSSLSPLYKDKVNNKVWARVQTADARSISKERRLQVRIIEKDTDIARMSEMTGKDQVWPKFDYNAETINFNLIEQLNYGNNEE